MAATSAARAGQDPSPGAVTGRQGESQPPSPPQKRASGRGEKGWGSRGAPCRPCAMSTGPRHASHARGTGGCGIAAAAITRGTPGCLGEDSGACRCRGGATAASRRVDLRRVGDYASPHDRGVGGRPSKAGDGGVAPRRHTGPGSGPWEGLRGGHIATGRRPSAALRHTGGPGVG